MATLRKLSVQFSDRPPACSVSQETILNSLEAVSEGRFCVHSGRSRTEQSVAALTKADGHIAVRFKAPVRRFEEANEVS